MQNSTAEETNLTCNLCSKSPFSYMIMPYILISLPANSWVLWLMMSSKGFWTDRMEVFAFHLVLIEMLFGLLGPPLLIIRLFFDFEVADRVTQLINIMMTARVQFQNSICVERFFAVRRPMLYCRYKALRYRMNFSWFLWLQAILVSIPQMFLCTGQAESLIIYKSYFLTVFFVNSFCCSSVLRALKQPSPGEGEREGSKLIKQRAFNIVLIFQMNALIGYLPLSTMYFLVNKLERNTLCVLLPLAYAVMVWMGILHPLLYLHRAGKHLLRKDICVNCVQV